MARHLSEQPEFLKGELEKLHLFLINEPGGFTKSKAEELLSVQREEDVFAIVGHILQKNKIKALEGLNSYLKNAEDFIFLQVMLHSEAHKLLKYLELQAAGVKESDVFAELKTYGYKQHLLKKNAAMRSLPEMYSLLGAIGELERILKSESISSEDRDRAKINLLGKHWLLKIISSYS